MPESPLQLQESDSDRLYGVAGRAAGEAVLEHGRDGARLRSASDAFLLSRIARAVVDALRRDVIERRCPYCQEPVDDGPAFVDGDTDSLWHDWCWDHDQTFSGLSPEDAARLRKRSERA